MVRNVPAEPRTDVPAPTGTGKFDPVSQPSALANTQTALHLQEGRWPVFAQDEIDAAVRVMESGKVNYWTGDEGRLFESEFAAFTHTSHAVALANGTLALEAALIGCGIGPGDDVLVAPRTFLASATCVLSVGATPVFADIDPVTGNVTAETLEQAWTPKTKAAIPVHLAGWPCEMPDILALAGQKGFAVIEDCAQAHGASIDGRSVGSFGKANAWSFCQDKIMTTLGEGGMVTTNDQTVWQTVWSHKDHGKSYEAVYNRPHPPGFRWLHEGTGSNWRLTEPQSAVGRVQLSKLPAWSAARRANAQTLAQGLQNVLGVIVPQPRPGLEHAYYKFYFHIDPASLADGWTTQRLVEEVEKTGVKAFTGTCCEVYLEKGVQDLGLAPKTRLPNAKAMGENSLMLLVHPTLTPEYMAKTVQAVTDSLRLARR